MKKGTIFTLATFTFFFCFKVISRRILSSVHDTTCQMCYHIGYVFHRKFIGSTFALKLFGFSGEGNSRLSRKSPTT